jgi:hypothetical protein
MTLENIARRFVLILLGSGENPSSEAVAIENAGVERTPNDLRRER